MDHIIGKLGILCAMEGEAAPIIDRLGLREVITFEGCELGLKAFEGEYQSLKIQVAVNGKDPKFNVDSIGTDIATLSTYLLIRRFAPDLLLNMGTAGGFREKGARIGSVYLAAEKVVHHDRRIPIPGFDQYGIGSARVLPLKQIPELLGAECGVVSTGNSLDLSPADAAMMQRSGAAAKDMEAAAIARIAETMSVPIIVLKTITDFADSACNHDEFMKHYTTACQTLGEKAEKLIAYVAQGRYLKDL